MNHLEETKGLGEKVTELAANFTSKTADVLAKPILSLMGSTEKAETPNAPHSAMLKGDDTFFSSESPQEHEPLRSKTLVNDQHYSKTF